MYDEYNVIGCWISASLIQILDPHLGNAFGIHVYIYDKIPDHKQDRQNIEILCKVYGTNSFNPKAD